MLLQEGPGADHALRYMSMHDNKFLRYLKGHTQAVTSLGIAPKSDLIMSTSQVSPLSTSPEP